MAKQQTNQQQVKATARQSGWGFIQIVSTVNSATATVTFPTAFAVVPKSIIVTLTGYRATGGGAPTSLADFNTAYGNNYSQSPFVYNASNTGFSVGISAGTSNSIGASYIGFSWIAEAA